MPTSYNVRIFKLETYEGKKRNTYYVRWRVDKQRHAEPFVNDTQADSFRSELMHAAKQGELFDVERAVCDELPAFELGCALGEQAADLQGSQSWLLGTQTRRR